ncbi:LacI family DNA-binding transcriptional regulator [Bacillus tianshenii]|nr:LacI family DNA-binding transcriptional regulator [Bacillus tianshenii]
MATIRDVAKQAGVSVATVSRVLNNNGYVNAKTREKVMKTIDELEYRPNAVARSLYKKKSKMIGVIVPDITNPFFPELARAIEDVTNKADYTFILCNSDEDVEKEKQYIEVLRQKYVDGFIIVTSTLKTEHIKGLDVPIVALDRPISPNMPTVTVNNYDGAREAVQHLKRIGCEKIAHIRGPHNVINADERCRGYVDEVQDEPWFYSGLIAEGNYHLKDTMELAKSLLQREPDIDGIFAGNDVMATAVLKAAEELGKRVPQDLNVIGFDGISLCEVTSPSLTTMEQPIYEIGSKAANMLLNLIEERELDQDKCEFKVKLIKRQSTKA